MSKPANYDEQLKYYTDNYDEVNVVTCGKCGAVLAFEVKGGVAGAFNQSHHNDFEVIPVSWPEHPQGMALMSWRARLDGQMGYQCGAMVKNPDYKDALKARDKEYAETLKDYKASVKGTKIKDRAPEPVKPDVAASEYIYCDNNTLLANVEQGGVPTGNGAVLPTMSPFDRENLRNTIAASNNEPDVEVKGKVTRVESFKIERIK